MLAQCENGAVLLVSFETQEILCYFQALNSHITNAVMFLSVEYLAVSCANGNIYIFNMIIQAIEREITGDSVFLFDCRKVLPEKSLIDDKNEEICACLHWFFVDPPKKAVNVKFISIGTGYLPSLQLNLQKLVKNKGRYSKTIIKNIETIINGGIFKQGVFSVNKAISFKCNFIESKHFNSLKIAGLLTLGLKPSKQASDSVSFIIYSLKSNFNLRVQLIDYLDYDEDLLKLAESLLFSKIKAKRTSKRAMTHASCTNFSNEKYHCQRVYISLLEALGITILASFSIISRKIQNNPISLLIQMIKSGEEGYILTGCELLYQGNFLFSSVMTPKETEEIIKELLLYSCKSFKNTKREYFYRTLTCIGLNNLTIFFQTLATEIKHNDFEDLYKCTILFLCEYFIQSHFLEASSVLDDIGDFLLRANETKVTADNKDFNGDFTTLLQSFASLLPMLNISQDFRYLITGLPTGWLNLYDLKAGKK